MTRRTHAAALAGLAVLLTLAGCSGGSEPTAPSESPAASAPVSSAPASSEPASTGPSAAPSTAASPGGTSSALVPGADCLDGRYRLVRFVGIGDQATYGTGQGGDVTVEFGQGGYLLEGQGKEPVVVTLAGQSANLFVDGTLAGTYVSDGAEMTFTIGETSGEGRLEAGGQPETISMEQIGNVLAPTGKATLSCQDALFLIALDDVRLEFEPI